MKKGVIILLLTAIASIAAYGIYYHHAKASTEAMLCQAHGELEWLKHEFELSEAEFEKIKAMHEAYRPVCDLLCRRIAEAQAKLGGLMETSRSVTSELEAALKECAAVQAESQQTLLAHVYAVSAEMNPESGARYLRIMKTRIVQPARLHDE